MRRLKLLLDFLPLILFFGTYKYAETHAAWAAAFATEHFGFLVSGGKVGVDEGPVMLATLVVIAATLLQVLVVKLQGRKGGPDALGQPHCSSSRWAAPPWFHSKTFIMWKPTGLYWGMALVFWGSATFFGKNLIQSMLGAELELPAKVWSQLNRAWVLFFGAMGCSTSTWLTTSASPPGSASRPGAPPGCCWCSPWLRACT